MSDRSQPPAGIPRLLDQYKQRRQAWLDQADELARLRDDELSRLRDEVRLAAEREALDIVTTARRDVRRIIVEARRELLVLTAQLHASVASSDQASLQPGAESGGFAAQIGTGSRFEALGATRDAVLGARREVRSVLDEARAEIEALAAEARTRPSEFPASLPPAPVEPPIPTLETILGSDPLAHTTAPALAEAPPIDLQAAASLPSERHQPTERAVPDVPVVVGPPAPAPVAAALADAPPFAAPPISVLPQQLLEQESDATAPAVDAPRSFVLAPDADAILGGFHKPDSDETAVLPVTMFGEMGTLHLPGSQTPSLEDDDSGWRSKPMWAWAGMFAATGILLLAGAAWWAQARETRSTLLASITETNPTAVPGSGGTPGGSENDRAAAATRVSAPPAPEAPAGLAIEVRRTSWLRAIVDGKEDSRVYQAGETRNIAGAHSVSLRAGDGGAVFVAVDGRPAEALGVAGTAVTRQYSLAGPAVVPAVATAPQPTPAANVVTPVTPAATLQGSPASASSAAAPRPADVPAAPLPAPQAAAPATPNESTVAPAPTGGRADLVSAGQQWLDAYQRRDRDGMAAAGIENVTISDERSLTERFPAWQTGIRRDLDQVELELTGDTALLTARMTERNGDTGATSAQHVSRVSQIWVRRNGRWRVADVRIMGEGRLNQIVR